MAGMSALLKSAQSVRKRIREQQQAEVAFEWQQSAKTYQDFQAYEKFLNGQIGQGVDPSENLSIRRAISSARSGYISNEIQRQSINVLEGRSTNSDKYNSMVNLFYQAVDNGNYDLAQSLNLQLDNLSVKIQNEAEAAQRAAGAMAMNGVKTLGQLVKKIQKGEDFIQLPDGTVLKPFAMLNNELTAKGETSADYFGELYRTAQAMQNLVADAYMGATTQDAVDAIEEKYGDILRGDKAFKTLGGSLNLQDMELAYRSSLANNPLYSVTSYRDPNSGQLNFKLQKNKTEDFAWIRNDDGSYEAVEVKAKQLDPYQKLDTQITNEGYIIGNKAGKNQKGKDVGLIAGGTKTAEYNPASSIKNRLANMGYTAKQNSDGTLSLTTPEGEVVQASIDPGGNIRYFGEPGKYTNGQAGMYELNILNGKVREVAPDEISMFGQESNFGGLLSKSSDVGKRITQSLAGVTKPKQDLLPPSARITNIKNDFSGHGTPIFTGGLQGTTSNILQGAEQVQQQRQMELQAQAAAIAQQAQVFNLNQTPVQQYAQNGAPIRQLTVAKPTAQPTIRVAAPTPTPRITSVGVAQPTSRISGVAKPSAQPTIRVGR